MRTFNVLFATLGDRKESLQRAIDSIQYQLTEYDYLTIIYDRKYGYYDKSIYDLDIKTNATLSLIHNYTNLGSWGHKTREKWQDNLPGEYMINGDDDDIFTNDAMQSIREHCTEDKLYFFQMQRGEEIIPKKHELVLGNIGTPCGVYMMHDLPEWPNRYGGDYEFYFELSKTRPVEFVDKIIYILKRN